MPLDKLCNDVINGEMPREIKKAAAGLRHSGGYMVGIGIKQPCPSHQELDVLPRRQLPVLSRHVPEQLLAVHDAGQGHALLAAVRDQLQRVQAGRRQARSSTTRSSGLINAGLIKEEDRKDIVDTWVYHADYSYPTPSVERDAILAQVIPYLEQHDIYSRGRFGMWKYEVSNTDHTLMQGVELVNRLLLDEPETTIGMKYASTLDGRNAAVHERSDVAGSG